ncbi:MAG TPA: hypothetical protein PKD86_01260 [Gemmatales bacterium]|nr:hypothetical protein [Gemmatales bacterium]HMP57953.1 hypothetical protein [Gemmatales bacterium]
MPRKMSRIRGNHSSTDCQSLGREKQVCIQLQFSSRGLSMQPRLGPQLGRDAPHFSRHGQVIEGLAELIQPRDALWIGLLARDQVEELAAQFKIGHFRDVNDVAICLDLRLPRGHFRLDAGVRVA